MGSINGKNKLPEWLVEGLLMENNDEGSKSIINKVDDNNGIQCMNIRPRESKEQTAELHVPEWVNSKHPNYRMRAAANS